MRAQICFLAAMVVFVSVPTHAATIYFAQVADGGGYVTSITLCNPTSSSITGTLKFYRQDGTTRFVRIDGVNNWQFAVTIPARGSRRLVTAGDTGNVSSGWASFESSGTVQGVATFEMRYGAVLRTLAGVLGSQPVSRFALPVDVTSLVNTGFAIANQTTAAPITIKLTLVDEEGNTLASGTLPSLNPLYVGCQVTDFVTSAFPSVGIGFKGSVIAEVVGSGTMIATGLTVKESMLSALPIFETSGVPTPTCTYSISPTSRSHTAAADSGTITVTASSGCGWTAKSNVTWVTITAGGSGTGNGSVTYSVAANTGQSSRSGTITVSGQSYSADFQVNQAVQSAPTSKERAEKILGSWTFTYTILSVWTDKYSLTYVKESTTTPGQYLAWGVDEYGNPVAAQWFDDTQYYMLVDLGTIIDQIYTFNFTGTNTVSGCYYQHRISDDSLSKCYALTGVRTATSPITPTRFLDERIASESQKAIETQSSGGTQRITPHLREMLERMRETLTVPIQ